MIEINRILNRQCSGYEQIAYKGLLEDWKMLENQVYEHILLAWATSNLVIIIRYEQPRSNYLRAFSIIPSYECFAVSQNASYENISCCILSYECFAVSQDVSFEIILFCILSYEHFSCDKSQSRIAGLSQPEALVTRASSVLIYNNGMWNIKNFNYRCMSKLECYWLYG